MDILNRTFLVTGANRGLGREFARQLVERGAGTVYAGARDPHSIDLPGVVPVALDVTDPESIEAARSTVGAIDGLINNAGVTHGAELVTADLDLVRREFEVNVFGTLGMVRAFSPSLAGGAILNVLSRLSWTVFPGGGGYAASKAAGWSLTNTLRIELAGQGTQVTGLYLSATDTDMMAGWDIPTNDPVDVVRLALDGVEAGASEVIADDDTAESKRVLGDDPAEVYAALLAS